MVLRGIFLVRKKEIDWFYQRGASAHYPDAWEKYVEPIPETEHGNLLAAFHKRLLDPDPDVRMRAAKAWSIWEGTTSCLVANRALIERTEGDAVAFALARIECHYFVHDAWVDPPRDLVKNVARIRHVPATIVQGRYDVVCPMETAWELHRAWPEADFRVVPDAGHSAGEPGVTHELIEATDRYR
jgi:proline iminopeptidase